MGQVQQRTPAPMSLADDLHRRANNLLTQSHGRVFDSLPHVIGEIIKAETWKGMITPFDSFAQYALHQGIDGLCIDSNQKLWILRCAMDVNGAHMEHWGDIVSEVDKMVRVQAAEEGGKIRQFSGNSLEKLAKACIHGYTGSKITYLPSRSGLNGNSIDANLVAIRRRNPEVYQRLVRGELTVSEARREAGLKAGPDYVSQAKAAVKKMTPDQLEDFFAWVPLDPEARMARVKGDIGSLSAAEVDALLAWVREHRIGRGS